MNSYSIASFLSFLLCIIFFLLGFIEGDIQSGLFLFIPFITGTGLYAFLGSICVFCTIVFLFLSFTTRDITNESLIKTTNENDGKNSIKGGGALLFGPIPIVFTSSSKSTLILMICAMICVFLIMIFLK
jgi:uncharacterized protein (TIGR00304 family)